MTKPFSPLEEIIGCSLHSLPKCNLLDPTTFDHQLRLRIFRPNCCACSNTCCTTFVLVHQATRKKVWVDLCDEHMEQVHQAAQTSQEKS